jgi:Kef-type K+ transport system membrane component KefB/mannitol/fructose-specific phosphotransferase system IIA component (Ntr-type)
MLRTTAAAILLVSLPALASNGQSEALHEVTRLVLQIGVIILAAAVGKAAVASLQLPAVLGELAAGVVIGPYLLGSLAFPGFAQGLFPLSTETALPVPTILYAIASIASVVLLFMSGLETDVGLFLRYSLPGAVVGLGGVVVSFLAGLAIGVWGMDLGWSDPGALFLGVISTATSVGITARILSVRRKIDSPEGVTILAGAVIDDVLGIIALAVVSALTVIAAEGGELSWGPLRIVTLRALGLWLAFTAIALLLSHKIGQALKITRDPVTIAVRAFALALLFAGIFEKVGLSMIIGAYVMGLALSRTDLCFVIQDALRPLYSFFVPIFFTVMGMLVDVHLLVSPQILGVGVVYTIAAVAAKLAGCGLPALFLDFNRLGALRIGLGMVPRGEVALIVAGIGLAQGAIDSSLFGAAIIMTVLTTLIAPILLDISLRGQARGTRKPVADTGTVETAFDFSNAETMEFVQSRVVDYLRAEGYFVHHIETEHQTFQARKEKSFMTLACSESAITFKSSPTMVAFVRTMMLEVLLGLYQVVDKLKSTTTTEELRKDLAATSVPGAGQTDLRTYLSPRDIIPALSVTDKRQALEMLVDMMHRHGHVRDRDKVMDAVWEREESMSTGMQDGVAIPHARTEAVDHPVLAMALAPEGIDYGTLDGSQVRIIVLLLTPPTVPHIHVLAGIGALLSDPDARKLLLTLETREQIHTFFASKNV